MTFKITEYRKRERKEIALISLEVHDNFYKRSFIEAIVIMMTRNAELIEPHEGEWYVGKFSKGKIGATWLEIAPLEIPKQFELQEYQRIKVLGINCEIFAELVL
jgi:hypothetical protein